MIVLTDEMRDKLGSALTDGCPVVAATVELNGQPKMSFYGSTHVHSVDSLALWVRNPEGGLLSRIPNNNRIALLYRNPAARLAWQFQGRMRVVADDAERDRVYAETPELERLMDPDVKGVAVVVDLDKVSGRDLEMLREDG